MDTGIVKSGKTLEPEEAIEEKINWPNVLGFIFLHVVSVQTVGRLLTGEYYLWTFLFTCLLTVFGGIGNTVGAHRLWAHRSYKANWAVRLFLVLCQTLMVQNSVFRWVAWHRAHHKYSETERDPHNAKRGFFYSHIGWLLLYNPASFDRCLNSITMADLEQDGVVMWQHKYYDPLVLLLGLIMPTLVPWYCWNESIWGAMAVCVFFRLTYNYHTTFLVNSAAHLWGPRPYDKGINPTENKMVSILALGEGWHNYHHVFPWDYRASEYGLCQWNPSTGIIEFFARQGWAHDLKTVSPKIVAERIERTGDGSWPIAETVKEKPSWGWGDEATPEECLKLTTTLYPSKNG